MELEGQGVPLGFVGAEAALQEDIAEGVYVVEELDEDVEVAGWVNKWGYCCRCCAGRLVSLCAGGVCHDRGRGISRTLGIFWPIREIVSGLGIRSGKVCIRNTLLEIADQIVLDYFCH